MHQEEVDIAGVVDEEGFVAGGHEVAGFLVGAESNLGKSRCQQPAHNVMIPVYDP